MDVEFTLQPHILQRATVTNNILQQVKTTQYI